MSLDKVFRIVIASDHAGFELKQKMVEFLHSKGHFVVDVGTHSADRTDYPDHAHRAVSEFFRQKMDLGILICGSGNGVNMAANKHEGIRSALAWNPEIAALAKQHNNANMIALPARYISNEEAFDIVTAFIDAKFEGGRHQIRVNKIDKLLPTTP
jgi:ribose 5-phosphate isomerase B